MSKLGRLTRFTPKSRRGRIVAGFASFLVFVTVGAAIALFVSHATIKGGVTSTQFSPTWQSAVVTSHTDMTCSTQVSADNMSLTLNVLNAYPGGSCSVDSFVGLQQGSSEGGKVTGIAMTLPTGWTASITTGCGAVVPMNTGVGQVVEVVFKVTMGATAVAGSSSTFGVGDGIAISPASQNAPLGAGCI